MALTDSLISVWELAEASGNALDSHGSNELTENSGIIAASSGPASLAGSRDIEDADSESFDITDNASLSTGDIDFTFAVWVYLEDGGARVVAAKGDTGLSTSEWILNHTGTRMMMTVYGSSSTQVQAHNYGGLPTSTWLHVVCWHDSVNNQIGISINAGTPDTTSHSAGCNDTASAFRIGAYVGMEGFWEGWDGLLAQAAFWKRVLTSQERTDLYAAGSGLPYSSWGGGGAGQPTAKRMGGVLFAPGFCQGVSGVRGW